MSMLDEDEEYEDDVLYKRRQDEACLYRRE
jgi:hypothetical protein